MCIQGLVSPYFSFVSDQSVCRRSSGFDSSVKKISQQGVSLIEVLVTLVLVAIGLSGMMIMQVRGLEQNQSAYLQTQAVAMASDLADRMRLNKRAALNDFYRLGKNETAADFANSASTPIEKKLADNDLNTWLAWVETSLPKGDAVITRNNQVIQIRLSWGGESGKLPGNYTHEIDLI